MGFAKTSPTNVDFHKGCIRRAVFDLADAVFADSAWLFCRQTRPDRTPLIAVWKLLVAGPPEFRPSRPDVREVGWLRRVGFGMVCEVL